MKFFLQSIAILFLLTLILMSTYFYSISEKSTLTKNIWVENPINLNRANETITISTDLIKKIFPKQNTKYIEVKDLKTDKILVTQSIDLDQDGHIDEILFQSDFLNNEKKKFALSVIDQDTSFHSKVYAAYVPTEVGMDDFTWENDFIGYRFYGTTRAQKQGTGTAIDIWCKRCATSLTKKWYAHEHYHDDIGYGADHYSSGKNQGCGGSGILVDDSIYYSKVFSDWKIISDGPIRTTFELTFTGWAIDTSLVETKRVSLDAGHYFNRIESSYHSRMDLSGLRPAIGIVQHEHTQHLIEIDKGLVACWEALDENNGELGTGFISSADNIKDIKTRNNHVFSFLQLTTQVNTLYYTGAAWSEFGTIHSLTEWKTYMENQALQIKYPCIITYNI
jgi:hypothetical protein